MSTKVPAFTEDDARLADFFANWYMRRAIEHRRDCPRRCPHFIGIESNIADSRALATKIRQHISTDSMEAE